MRGPVQPPMAAHSGSACRLAVCLCVAAMLASACATKAESVPTSATGPDTSAGPAHAPEIRIGLIGALGDQNVWSLFSGERYSYNDYAVRARYWPRLFELSIPELNFEPRLASGMPMPVRHEGAFQVASVPLRTDLRWTDGSAFTAEDVAFTVNAALQFELGFDWGAFYDGDVLDHAEAVSPDTVEFFFKSRPGLEAWQFGALQGPVVQATYWAPKVAKAAALLPTQETRARIPALLKKMAELQGEVNRLYAAILTAKGEQARELQAELRRQQGNLDEATNDLADEQARLKEALEAARLALFQQEDSDEPLLGPWLPGQSSEAEATNIPNAAYPGAPANFDQATYVSFASASAASQALAAGEVNLVLDPSARQTSTSTKFTPAMVSPSRSLRLLVFNVNSAGAGDSAMRNAIACMLDQAELVGRIGEAVELTSLIPPQESAWHNPEATLPCAGLDAAARLAQATETLKSAGYSWQREPREGLPGQGLRRPDGSAPAAMRLLAPSSDDRRAAAAAYIAERAAGLGIPLTTQVIAPDLLDYAVFSSGDFDAAVLGWRVGVYPGYPCNWFDAGGVFSYGPSTLPSVCGELRTSSDLEDARGDVYALQQALSDEMPLIPLYSMAIIDELRYISYPFPLVIDGLAGVYAAPALASPSAQ